MPSTSTSSVCERAVVDHLVVHGHQEERGRQRQEVDDHRGDAELPQHRAQPGHDGVPAGGMGRRLGQRLEQHDAFGEIGDRLEAAGGDALGVGLREHQMIAPPLGREPDVAGHPADHQKRRGRLGEIMPARLQRACLEAEPPGGQQDAADPDRAVGGGRCGPDLGGREGPIQRAAQLGEREDQVVGIRRGVRCGPLGPAPGYALRQGFGASAEPSDESHHSTLK